MDHPRLFEALAFLRSIGSVSSEFLQCDGLNFRSEAEIRALTRGLPACGVKHLNFTFYGTRAFHDRFAGRAGDFDYMLRLIDAARLDGLEISAGVPLTQENAAQVDGILDILDAHGVKKTTLFVPHEEGRGVSLNAVRFKAANYAALSERARALLNVRRFKAERDWLKHGAYEDPQRRSLIISLTPDNIDQLETTPFGNIVADVERLDEAYYGSIPDFPALAAQYGDPQGDSFYGQRDLFAHYAKAYIAEHDLRLYDVTDERFTGSRRY